jgi:hypothetical protein
MPRPRAVMRKIREVLRLVIGERLSRRRVTQITGVPKATIYDYIRRASRLLHHLPILGRGDDCFLGAGWLSC